jgi:hypothetical protein
MGVVDEQSLDPHEFQNVVELFAILSEIKCRQIKSDAKKYLGIDLEKFQSRRDDSKIENPVKCE